LQVLDWVLTLHFFSVEHVCENPIQASLLSPVYKMGNHNSATKNMSIYHYKTSRIQMLCNWIILCFGWYICLLTKLCLLCWKFRNHAMSLLFVGVLGVWYVLVSDTKTLWLLWIMLYFLVIIHIDVIEQMLCPKFV